MTAPTPAPTSAPTPIDAYVWTTPNGFKTLIALEELELPYTPRWVHIGKGEQHEPAFDAVTPNHKIPAIVDHDAGVTLFESGAIAVYLAEKAGRLLPASGPERYAVLQWVFFNIGGTGPMVGQLGHFVRFAPEQVPYAIDRYRKESDRLLGVLDRRLGEARYLGGDEYTIADLMNVTWARTAVNLGIPLDERRHLARWLAEVEARPAVTRALAKKP